MNAQKGFPIVRLDYTTMTENMRQVADATDSVFFELKEQIDGKDQDQEDCDEHVHQQLFGNQGIHLGDHEGAPPAAVRENKVQLLYEFVHLIVIDAQL